jgi:hypothetical protein
VVSADIADADIFHLAIPADAIFAAVFFAFATDDAAAFAAAD